MSSSKPVSTVTYCTYLLYIVRMHIMYVRSLVPFAEGRGHRKQNDIRFAFDSGLSTVFHLVLYKLQPSNELLRTWQRSEAERLESLSSVGLSGMEYFIRFAVAAVIKCERVYEFYVRTWSGTADNYWQTVRTCTVLVW